MFRTFSRLAALIFTAATLAIAGVIVFAPDPEPTLALLETPDCSLPCFLNITPGETSWEEGVAIIESHPWVDLPTGYEESMYWQWADSAPAFLDSDYPASMERSRVTGRIQQIEFVTRFPLGEVWLSELKHENNPRFDPLIRSFIRLRPGLEGFVPGSMAYDFIARYWARPIALRLEA